MSALGRATFMLYASIQFVVLTVCAMATYAGGTLFDPTTKRYGFFDNFFSDLGTTRAYSGRSNFVSCVLFVIALASIGAGIIAFASVWRSFAFGRSRARVLGVASQTFGTASGLAFVGIAFTPWNLLLNIHNMLVLAAFSLLLGYVACVTIVLWRNEGAGAQVAANCAYLVVLFGYVGLIFFGPSLRTTHGHLAQVTGQKVIVYVSMVNLMFQAFATRRTLARKEDR